MGGKRLGQTRGGHAQVFLAQQMVNVLSYALKG
jgi:hypothetical protein